ncbi:MAG: TIGR02147 family protein [Bdellovibrionales bacterium]|nr:TIGR02147 family protein [Bdellovibrionales bacterium]
MLQSELINRTAKNPKYSLRAFARQLGISAPVLSHLIGGRRPLTPAAIQKIGMALGLTPESINSYVAQFQKHSLTEEAPFSVMAMDVYNAIADWYHDAILELTHIPTFKADPKWIATTLGITIHEVNAAIERLQRLDLLDITQEGQWVDLSRDNTTQSHPDVTSAALRKYQEKILEFSLEALRNVPKPLRDHTSSMTAIDVADLAEVKMRIRNFRKELSEFLQRDGVEPNQLYQLAISYFPLTKIENGQTKGEKNEKL